jgi:hypothetical protein
MPNSLEVAGSYLARRTRRRDGVSLRNVLFLYAPFAVLFVRAALRPSASRGSLWEFAVYIGGLLVAAAAAQAMHGREQRQLRGMLLAQGCRVCIHCGHGLIAEQEGRPCPECGATVDLKAYEQARRGFLRI